MIRAVIENLLLFFAPTLVYVIYSFVRRRSAGDATPVFQDAPLVWLFVAGVCLMVATLVAFSTTTGGRPGAAYQPPAYKDGKIVPGRVLN
jgi:hypothetical protein